MKNSEKLEKILNKKLPKDYKEFIDNYGLLSTDGMEIYGYNKALKDINIIPSVIGATKAYKKDYNISDNELVIAIDDITYQPILLNIKNGKIYLINSNNRKELLFNSFNEFFNDYINNH